MGAKLSWPEIREPFQVLEIRCPRGRITEGRETNHKRRDRSSLAAKTSSSAEVPVVAVICVQQRLQLATQSTLSFDIDLSLGCLVLLLLLGRATILRSDSSFLATLRTFSLHFLLLLLSLRLTGRSRSRSRGDGGCLRVLDLEVLLDAFEPSLAVGRVFACD